MTTGETERAAVSESFRPWKPYTVGGTDTPRNETSARQVSIVLSLYNGEAFLNAQLDSILAQTYANWKVYWRDDGSIDASRAIMLSFQAHRGAGRCVEVTGLDGQVGIADSYLALVRQVPPGSIIAFSDQDDVWFPDKLKWGLQTLDEVQSGIPALYCARQRLTDKHMRELGQSSPLPQTPTFEAALTQNIATGCTVMINDEARLLLQSVSPPKNVLHDWWSYLLVCGAGGVVRTDSRLVLSYRQHGLNAVGAQTRIVRRAASAWRRGPNKFMALFSANIRQLADRDDLLSASSREVVQALDEVLRQGKLARLRALRRFPLMARQTWYENLVFKLWFILGRVSE